MIWFICLLSFGLLLIFLQSISINEVRVDRIELLNSSYLAGVYNVTHLKIEKINNTNAFQADVDFLVDIDQNWLVQTNYYYSQLNDSYYDKTSYRALRTPVCAVFERYKSFMRFDATKNNTNFPNPQRGKKICPIKAVNIDFLFLNSNKMLNIK